jgi:sugar phosphate isomerase/epimerase
VYTGGHIGAVSALEGDTMSYTRREFGKLALSAIPAANLLPTLRGNLPPGADKPNSKVAGVQIGMNVPYNFGNLAMSGDDILTNCVQLGISGIELRSQPVEAFLGLPADLVAPRGGGRGTTLTPEQIEDRKNKAKQLAEWRTSISMDRVKVFRENYENAGVLIQIVKFDGVGALSDGELDYSFALAKNLGAKAISCEISLPDAKRLGPFADKHKMMVGYHGHEQATPEMFEEVMSYAKYNACNVDIGHFIAGNNTSPVPFIKEHHARITHVHIKDMKLNHGPAVPFGTGDTPIREVLDLIRDNKWPMQATIEFEYPVPPDSTRMAEIAKCIQYCRDALA